MSSPLFPSLVIAGIVLVTCSHSMKAAGQTPALEAPASARQAKAKDNRLPLPSAEARRASAERVKGIFADDYEAATTTGKKIDLAKRLIDQASTTDKPADRWTLLSEGLRLATEAGDATVVLPLIERIPNEFAVERNGPGLEALTRLAAKVAPPLVEEVANACLQLARQSAEVGDEEVATKAAALTANLARKSRNPSILSDATRLQQQIKDQQKLAKEIAPLIAKVRENPADPEANLEAGRALCFKADRWNEGLPLLSRGADSSLARIANADVANPVSTKDMVALADAWWDWAETQKPQWKLPAQNRASLFYGRAMNDLQGLDKARVEKRIESAAASGGGTGQTVFLADLPDPELKNVFNNLFSTNGTLGSAFTVGGQKYPKAIMALPNASATSVVTYRLPTGVVRSRGKVGIFTPATAKPNDQPASPITFQLVADGQVAWTSPALKRRDETATFDVIVRNANILELRTICSSHNNNAWAAWLDPVIIK